MPGADEVTNFILYRKTALMLALCNLLRDKYSLAAVTNDIFTKEDGEFLVKHGALPEERIRAVETGGCPHAAIREDISINLGPLEELSSLFKADLLLCESGGDNLAANFSRELADYIIYIIDVSGGDKIPRKGGPGITQADLLVINKTDLAPAVGADLGVMERDALRMRDGGPFVFTQVKHGVGVAEIVNHGTTDILTAIDREVERNRNRNMGEAEEGKKRRVVVESLGWLTESSILPKKQRAIEGVGASSIVELKAQLYKSQEDAKKSKDFPDADYHRAKKKITPLDSFSAKNSGVDARALKDKLELKAVKDGSASYAALEKKAELYDRLVKGELSDEEDKEKYCVDFFRKGVEQEESPQPRGTDTSATVASKDEDGGNDGSVPLGVKFVAAGRTAGAVDREEHKRLVREVHEEANQAREKASELKLRRQEQAAAHREKLKQAYLRKKLEKLKASSNTGQA
ncbi:hypothetical protein Tsubulata_031231 [Turnera subulata]|uniref:Urease accessory protein G n=1 Tax=Turnera subulata TaxID=218843 RepID=A0A9Q0G776_9ROSI|nr:hypothetical protein Tsubulata_031231 [Turnera subulata]